VLLDERVATGPAAVIAHADGLVMQMPEDPKAQAQWWAERRRGPSR
jgi:hypothetical protein